MATWLWKGTRTALAVALALAAAPARAGFIDEYQANVAVNATEATNPVLRLLSGFDALWLPGPTFDTGEPTAAGAPVLAYNIDYVVGVTARRSAAQADAAYLDDRRNQSYSVIDGLGPLAPFYRAGSGALTTIPDAVPAEASARAFSDTGTGAGLASSPLGSVVSLVATLRGPFSSTTPAKNFFLYPRPFRQSAQVVVVPTLVPVISPTPAGDSAFPSGHTNAGYLAALGLAYAVPERFQELLVRASELGDHRIVAGMHAPLDVMGGRVQATALAAAILSDPANAALKQAAHEQAQAYFLAQTGATSLEALDDLAHAADPAADRFADAARNRAQYRGRLTYGFGALGAPDAPVAVPAGAEVLLETRLPYLDAAQRREVLRSTGLASGYPVLDDAEGWGRLDLFAAADGYGAFAGEVTVGMDAARGGFQARDAWRNDISGPGGLLKRGTGTLILSGANTYTGGTRIAGGALSARSPSALGTGPVALESGALRVDRLRTGPYTQRAAGTLVLESAGARGAVLTVDGRARLAGTLRVQLAADLAPAPGVTVLELIRFRRHQGVFARVDLDGLPAGLPSATLYTPRGVYLVILNFARGPQRGRLAAAPSTLETVGASRS